MNRKIFYMNFQPVESCPACGSDQKELLGALDRQFYAVEDLTVPYKDSVGPIMLYRCSFCGLIYKNYVPSRNSLLDLYKKLLNTHWNMYYNYTEEIESIRKLYPQGNLNVLDIGAGNGAWLASLSSITRQLSALDVIVNPNCKKYLTGEYIIGFLDSKELAWSGQSYDLVTLYDVVEHLYDVKEGFANLRKLTSIGGYCLVETGDANNYYSKFYGVNNWWYLNLLEHNVLFDAQSLTKAGNLSGFEVVEIKKKRHKNRANLSWAQFSKLCLLSILYSVCPGGYMGLKEFIKGTAIQPASPFCKDHLMVIFRRVD